MTYKDDLIAARNAGRAAKPGDINPYAGRGALADLWRLGYQAMLLDAVNQSEFRQPFLTAEN